jgi:secretion/DNA translocation related CpaE-like protein
MDRTSAATLLLVSEDPALQGDVARLAAAANVGVETCHPARAVERWRHAPAVLVGADATVALRAAGPGRRDDVWVLTSGPASEQALRSALGLGAAGVVELPGEAALLGAWLADLGDRTHEAPSRGRVVAVLGASGGVGASVLGLALGEVAASAGPALLVDLDPWGLPAGALAGTATPSSGSDADGEVTWTDLAELDGRLGARALRESLPERDGLRVLGWAPGRSVTEPPMPVVREVVAAARRGHGWVVLDVPRTPATREVLALCDAVAVVAAPTLAGTAGAARAGTLVPDGVAAGVVARTGRGAWPDDLAALTGLPLWATLGPQRALDEHLAAGLGAVRARRSPCARAAREVMAAVDATLA